jgi:hypothetical protein
LEGKRKERKKRVGKRKGSGGEKEDREFGV